MKFIDYYDFLKKKLEIEKANEIVARIRKPPKKYNYVELFEKMEDKMEIEKVELADDKTIRTYVKGGKEPIRMYPDIGTVWVVACYKRLIPLLIKNLVNMGWIKRIITLLAIKFNFKILPEWFDYLFTMNQVLLNDENYSQPVKEIRRVLEGKLDQNIIDGLALILEYDSAYKYRFQDIIMELNKDKLNKPANEIIRLFNIIAERDYQDRFKSFRKLIKPLFIISPRIKRAVVSILRDINIDEVKLSKEDIYWTNTIAPYQFRGLSVEQRKNENIINYGE